VSNDTFAMIDDLVIKASNSQSGTDVVPIRLVKEVRLLRPEFAIIKISQLIDELGTRNLGRIEPPSDEPGERLFFIDNRGVAYAEQVIERRRLKSPCEKLSDWTRTDWIALGAVIISALSLIVSIVALAKQGGQ
jgi:hypothetical protein